MWLKFFPAIAVSEPRMDVDFSSYWSHTPSPSSYTLSYVLQETSRKTNRSDSTPLELLNVIWTMVAEIILPASMNNENSSKGRLLIFVLRSLFAKAGMEMIISMKLCHYPVDETVESVDIEYIHVDFSPAYHNRLCLPSDAVSLPFLFSNPHCVWNSCSQIVISFPFSSATFLILITFCGFSIFSTSSGSYHAVIFYLSVLCTWIHRCQRTMLTFRYSYCRRIYILSGLPSWWFIIGAWYRTFGCVQSWTKGTEGRSDSSLKWNAFLGDIIMEHRNCKWMSQCWI